MHTPQHESLQRSLGARDVAINVINISIASGIFLLPALIAGVLGSASVLAYGWCGLIFFLVALCYAEVGSRITGSGGAYAYIQAAFGPYAGFLANGLLWFGTGVLALAAMSNGIADMLSVPFPVFNVYAWRVVLFAVLFGLLGYLHVRGVQQGMIVIRAMTLIKVVPLVLLVVVGLFHLNGAYFNWTQWPTGAQLGEASIMLFFAFTGGETALNAAGEVKNPERSIPAGLLIGVGSIVVFYCLIQVVTQGVLGDQISEHAKAPLAAVAQQLLGPWGFSLLIACAILSIFGSINSIVLVFPRAMYAGAQDGVLPTFLTAVHPRFGTPHRAVIAFVVISFILAISGGFKQLLILATLSILLLHAGVALAAIRFRLTASPAPFQVRGGLMVPAVALLSLLWFLAQSKPNEYLAMGACLAVLSLVYVGKKYV